MNPVILAFNIRQSVYRAFGLSLFQKAKQYNLHLLPIITTSTDTIEDRAKKLNKQIPRLFNQLNIDTAHFACYSTCGVDFRFALSDLNIRQYCRSVTTISSPHKGSKLALHSDRNFFKPEIIDPISKLTGVGLRPFHEFTPENMAAFNNCIEDIPQIPFYSIGSERMPDSCYWALKETGAYLQYKTQTNFVYYNDGVFGHDQIVHGNHIVNFEADHAGVIGIFNDNQQIPALKTVFEVIEQVEGQRQAKTNIN